MTSDIAYTTTGRGLEVTFEGRTCILGAPTDVAAMRASVRRDLDRMAEMDRRIRMLSALADAIEADNIEDAETRRLARNAKSAATRRRHADPFGFRAGMAR